MVRCSHPTVSESRCADCGDCIHDVVLNGACYYCGASDIEVTVIEASERVVPAGRLRRRGE